MTSIKLYEGNCLDVLKKCPDNFFDSICTDPPYGLSFMGKGWDYSVPSTEIWKECLRVLKPGGHLLAFGGTRTYHRLVVNIEDAGFEIRDQIMWIYASGFPKSQSTQRLSWNEIIKCRSNENAELVVQTSKSHLLQSLGDKDTFVAAPALILPEGKKAWIIQTGKEDDSPGKTVTLLYDLIQENMNLNIEWSCDSTSAESLDPTSMYTTETNSKTIIDSITSNFLRSLSTLKSITRDATKVGGHLLPVVTVISSLADESGSLKNTQMLSVLETATSQGLNPIAKAKGGGLCLKPANEPICLARKPLSEKTVAKNVLKYGVGGLNVDASRIEGQAPSVPQPKGGSGDIYGFKNGEGRSGEMYETHSAGRFPANILFDEYAAGVLDEQSGILKSGSLLPGHKRGDGTGNSLMGGGGTVTGTYGGDSGGASRFFYVAKASKKDRGEGNTHPTVKPIKLMEYLVKLVTPEGGIVLDPFMGSGTTGVAAQNLGFGFRGIEMTPEYFEICKQRILGDEDNG